MRDSRVRAFANHHHRSRRPTARRARADDDEATIRIADKYTRTWTLVALKAATRPTKEEARSADIVSSLRVLECRRDRIDRSDRSDRSRVRVLCTSLLGVRFLEYDVVSCDRRRGASMAFVRVQCVVVFMFGRLGRARRVPARAHRARARGRWGGARDGATRGACVRACVRASACGASVSVSRRSRRGETRGDDVRCVAARRRLSVGTV